MRYSIFISAIVLVFCSCADNSEKKLQVYQSTIKSLERSDEVIKYATADVRKELLTRLNDSRYFQRAQIWHPISNTTSQLSSSLIAYIDDLKLKLVKESGNENNADAVFKKDYFKSVNNLFLKQGEGLHLYDSLKFFIDSISKTSIELGNELILKLKSDYGYLRSETNTSKEFFNTFFDDVSAAAALCALAKMKNDVITIENKMLSYCFNMTSPGCILQYDRFNAIVGQSSNCVKVGDNIELYAGIGSFSTAAQPKFLVDNKVLSCNDDGVMVYNFKTPAKAGKYNKCVKIEFYKPDGTKESKEYTIEYTVINPNQNPQ
jgi:hypothetical protein